MRTGMDFYNLAWEDLGVPSLKQMLSIVQVRIERSVVSRHAGR